MYKMLYEFNTEINETNSGYEEMKRGRRLMVL